MNILTQPLMDNYTKSSISMDEIPIHSVFENIVEQFPENIAINKGSRSITYQELNANANRVAHALTELGISPQSIAGIFCEASIEYVVAILGVLKAGAVFMPMNTGFPDKRLKSILDKTKPDIYITIAPLKNEFLERLQNFDLPLQTCHILVFNDIDDFTITTLPGGLLAANGSDFSDENPHLNTGPDDSCYVVTTSGSTGEPKAILGRHKGLSHFIHWEIDEFNLKEDIHVSMLSHVTFDVSLRDIFVPLRTGGMLCIPDEEERTNPDKLVKWLQGSGVTLMHIVPTLFRLLTREIEKLDRDIDILPHLEYALIAGEVLYGNDMINWRKATGNRIELINVYGPSETTLAKLFYRINGEKFSPNEIVPIGKPIPDTEVLIIKNEELCPVGETGEIHIKTPCMSKGYCNDQRLNEISFIQNPLVKNYKDIVYKTGDLGKYEPDNSVRFVGRIDGQIKLHGIRIEIGEIEVALSQHPQVRESAVVVRDDTFGNKRLVGYIVPETEEKPTVESLRSFISDKLPDYMIPALFVIMRSLPLTHNGKIDRIALPEPDQVRPEMEEPYVSPSNDLEKVLSEVWFQVLGFNQVGINDNFFDLGGSSILGVRVVALLKELHGIELPIVKLFQYPKISLLAKYLNQNENDQPSYKKVHDRARLRKAAFSRQQQLKRRR